MDKGKVKWKKKEYMHVCMYKLMKEWVNECTYVCTHISMYTIYTHRQLDKQGNKSVYLPTIFISLAIALFIHLSSFLHTYIYAHTFLWEYMILHKPQS